MEVKKKYMHERKTTKFNLQKCNTINETTYRIDTLHTDVDIPTDRAVLYMIISNLKQRATKPTHTAKSWVLTVSHLARCDTISYHNCVFCTVVTFVLFFFFFSLLGNNNIESIFPLLTVVPFHRNIAHTKCNVVSMEFVAIANVLQFSQFALQSAFEFRYWFESQSEQINR